VSTKPGNHRNDRNSDPSGDEAILNGGRRGLVFQKDSNFLDHGRKVGRSSKWSVNPYRQTAADPCDTMALVGAGRTPRHSGILILIAVQVAYGLVHDSKPSGRMLQKFKTNHFAARR
jgi:hypothetical protein